MGQERRQSSHPCTAASTRAATIRFVGRTCLIGSLLVVQVRVVIDVLATMNLRCFLVTGTPKAVATPMERAEMESIAGTTRETCANGGSYFALCA